MKGQILLSELEIVLLPDDGFIVSLIYLDCAPNAQLGTGKHCQELTEIRA